MEKFKNSIFIFLILLSNWKSSAQELNVGLSLGMNAWAESLHSSVDQKGSGTMSGTLEYRPEKAKFSVNTELRLLLEKSSQIKFPLYLNFIFGKKLKFCPSAGVFICTNNNYGGLGGANLEYAFSKKLTAYLRCEYFIEFYKEMIPQHMGSSQEVISSTNSYWFGFGVKFNMF